MKSIESIMDRGLKRAINQYNHDSKMALIHDNYPENGPFLVAKNINSLSFEAWYLKQSRKWKLFYDKNSREIWLYGDPTLPHETTAAWLSSEIRLLLYKLGGDNASDSILPEGSALRDIPAGRKEPDFSFTAVGVKNGPAIVGEVAYGHESLIKLKEEQVNWCESEHTQFFIGIKIVDNALQHHRDPKLILITWDRNKSKAQQLDFGYRTKCDSENKMFLEIPIKHLFHETQIPVTLKNHTHIKIDLFKLRSIIKNAVITYRGS